MPTHRPLKVQFWRYVAIGGDDECWPWAGSLRSNGYGQLRHLGRNLKAHRVSWEIHHGAIPPGLSVLHRCDNPPCVNPAHLFLGTNADNLQDAARKGRCRGKVTRGADNPSAKLFPELVAEIRASYASGNWTQRELAGLVGVHHSTIGDIIRGETWADA
jgi:DNA-binding XRE family transcriptional regulator